MARILEEIQRNAGRARKRIALGDAIDARILEASRVAIQEGIADTVLIGDSELLHREAAIQGISLEGMEIISSSSFPEIENLATRYYHRRKEKLASLDAALEEIRSNDLLFGAAYVEAGYADGMIAGSLSTTGDVIRAALKGIGLLDGISTLSSMFLLSFPPIPEVREHEFSLAFADAAVLVDPTAAQLADVAISTAKTYQSLTGNGPYVAMLSYSTLGSAQSDSTGKMIEATALARAKAPTLAIDGELQFDAAFVPTVAARKAKESTVAGRANVFIFPNLDAGNIGYKIAERLGMGQAIGPVLQGLRKPMNDLSRGASVSDIVNMIAITAVQNHDYTDLEG
ncbi:MAG TPA: phosphate acetyltransferase [Candidatus Kapabacteria bacterium]|nr:phosphate acetyltransferase [Candidatus Kapabacteria bacterium]